MPKLVIQQLFSDLKHKKNISQLVREYNSQDKMLQLYLLRATVCQKLYLLCVYTSVLNNSEKDN